MCAAVTCGAAAARERRPSLLPDALARLGKAQEQLRHKLQQYTAETHAAGTRTSCSDAAVTLTAIADGSAYLPRQKGHGSPKKLSAERHGAAQQRTCVYSAARRARGAWCTGGRRSTARSTRKIVFVVCGSENFFRKEPAVRAPLALKRRRAVSTGAIMIGAVLLGRVQVRRRAAPRARCCRKRRSQPPLSSTRWWRGTGSSSRAARRPPLDRKKAAALPPDIGGGGQTRHRRRQQAVLAS